MKVLWVARQADQWLFPWMPEVAETLAACGVQLELACCRIARPLAQRLRRGAVRLHVAQPLSRWPRLWQWRWNLPGGWPRADLYHFLDPGAGPRRAGPYAVVGHGAPAVPTQRASGKAGEAPGARRIDGPVRPGRGAPPLRLPIPIAVTAASRPADPAGIRRRLGLPEDAQLIGTAALLVGNSGLERLIWEIDLVHHVRPDARLVVLGAGPWRENLGRFAQLSRAARCTHFVADPQAAATLLPHLRCLVLPSDQPRLASWLAQAQACGVPLLAPDSPWARQYILPQVNGLLLPRSPSSQLPQAAWRLLSDRPLYERWSGGARQQGRNWPSTGQLAQQFRQAYLRRAPIARRSLPPNRAIP